MPDEQAQLLRHMSNVVHCDSALAVLTKPLPQLDDEQLACSVVARSQLLAMPKKGGPVRWLVPEPWNGNLRTAPLLFIGQNPSADHGEEYPAITVGEDFMEEQGLFDFFEGRFGTENAHSPIADGTRVRFANGHYPKKENRFLRHVKELADHAFGKKTEPGQDYAITEAVRCKAAKVGNIHLATIACAKKHLARTIELSGAKAIICLGFEARAALKIALQTLATNCKFEDDFPLDAPFACGERLILCLPHSNAWGNKQSDSLLRVEGLRVRLQNL